MTDRWKTKAVVFPDAGKCEWTTLTLREPQETDIVVRTVITAISPGTERWVLKGKHIGTKFPCVPGYMRIGVVETCGRAVSAFKPGDWVYGKDGTWLEPVHPMWGAHMAWTAGDWKNYRFISASPPDAAELELMVFTILAGVAHRGVRFCAPLPHQRMVIIGAGIIGAVAAQFAAHLGAVPILIEADPRRCDFLRPLVPDIICARRDDLDEEIRRRAPAGVDIVYDTAGDAAATDRMVKLMRPQGTLLLQAQYFDRERCAIDLDQIKIREITVRTTISIDDIDFFETLSAIRRRIIHIAPLITHRFQLKDALAGFQMLLAAEPFSMGMVIHWESASFG